MERTSENKSHNKNSFILYHDICESVSELTDEQAGMLFKEIIKYSTNLTQPNPTEPTGLNGLNGLMKAVFNPFACHIDRDFQRWIGICERNRNNGKYGGRPKQKKPSGPQTNPVKPDKDKDKDKDKDSINENTYTVVSYLNKVCNTKYKPTTPKTKTLVNARMKEGFSVSDFQKVVDKQFEKWGSNGDMCQYLRPETLFGVKFEGYLNAIPPKQKLHAGDKPL